MLETIADRGKLRFRPVAGATLRVGGVLGKRLAVNETGWLLRAPEDNPGLIGMFRRRDENPPPDLVPWAGEFVGKYLLSAIDAWRLSGSPALRRQIEETVRALRACQDDDGYLGPFPKAVRLTANWDLWGHYHIVEALLHWHEVAGDEDALAAAKRIGDLVCATFLGGARRAIDAGSDEMNLAMIHGLGQLYRRTGEARCFQMMREIEKDWERAGDYLRAGLAGVEFFASPRPRWESLHDLQGLLELYRITGRRQYRTAFEHFWRSIARNDRHNSGAFSTGEQATGDPYAPGAIETCCTVAWMALTADYLRLAGDPRSAEEMELSLYNGALGAQHPSGRWWTYDTPMDGRREPSHVSIAFQARPDTPELNCCSVNGPRALGMLADWAVLADDAGLAVNCLGPATWRGTLPEGVPVTLHVASDYPLRGSVVVNVEPARAATFALRLRLPGWAGACRVKVGDGRGRTVKGGRYLTLRRRWDAARTSIRLELDLRLRAVAGDGDASARVSLYCGPLLLAWDPRFAGGETPAPVDLARLEEATRAPLPAGGDAPLLLLDVPTVEGKTVRLCDYASAGAAGGSYRTWLDAAPLPPPPARPRAPRDGAALPLAPVRFAWTGPSEGVEYRLQWIEARPGGRLVCERAGIRQPEATIPADALRALEPGRAYRWRIVTANPHGQTTSAAPEARFTVDPALPPTEER